MLTLMEWHQEEFVDRFQFTQEVFNAFTVANPFLAEPLLVGEYILNRTETLWDTLDEAINIFNERTGETISLPNNTGHGPKLLLFTIWFRELARHEDEAFLLQPAASSRYDADALRRVAELTLEGKRIASRFDGLSKGNIDPITVRYFLGGGDPDTQLRQLL